jgi:hypothetical protein
MTRGRPRNALREPLKEHILAGGAPKEFAYDHGITRESAHGMLRQMGLQKYFLTPAEYKAVVEHRKAQKLAA